MTIATSIEAAKGTEEVLNTNLSPLIALGKAIGQYIACDRDSHCRSNRTDPIRDRSPV